MSSNDIDKEINEQYKMAQQLKEQVIMLENVAKQQMSKEAISRYGNLKIAHQETAIKAIAFIAQAIQSGYIKEKITDELFKEILRNIQEKKEFKFKK